MKHLSSTALPFLLALGWCAGVAGVPPARAADANSGLTLQVQVQLPPSHQPNPDQPLISAFVSRIRGAFARQGYAGSIAEAAGRDVPNETAILLNLDVTELRVRGDELDCSFTAGVRTNAESVDVGQFRDKGLHWNRAAALLGPRDRDNTDATMLRLYQAVAATRLVPGVPGS